ncbi:hypothetical protein LCGC14_2444490, partial [marine sediment metagenome]
MTLKYVYLRLEYFYLQIQSKIIRIVTKIAKKHLWFRYAYGWYFRRYKFNKIYEYGSYIPVRICDLYDDKAIVERFDWMIKMLIPEHLHYKIEYIKSKNGNFLSDTIGWIY